MCTLPQKNVEMPAHSTMIQLSLHQHLQQNNAPDEDAAVRSSIMHRFLRAAEEVTADHESSVLSPQSQTVPTAHRTKSRAQQVPKGFANLRPLHSRHQEDSMPHAMSCGFFCPGLKTALSRAHHTVDSASGHSTSRKKSRSRTPHPPNHMKGPVARKKKAMERMTKYESAINADVPVLHPLSPESVNVEESGRRHEIKYPASFSRRGYPGSDDCTNAGCNPALSQSAKANLSSNQFENMKSKHSPHDEHVCVRKFASVALKEQEIESVALCNQTRTCDYKGTCVCHHVENLHLHDLAGEINMSRNTFQDYMSGLEINGGKSIHDGDHYKDDEAQFCDALSTLNSVNSDATFYSFGSPKSECEVLGFEGERINNDPCAYDEHQQPESQTKSFSRLRRHSLDSINGLYPSKASAIFPMFPAKCQGNMPNALGWPFGIFSYQSSRVGGSPDDNLQEKKSMDNHAVGGNVPSTESWLGNVVTKNASKTSTLASLLQKEKDRRKSKSQSLNLDSERKLDFQWMNGDAERSWEDVVKGSWVHSGHLRYLEELQTLVGTSF